MKFAADAERFLALGSDRLVSLAGLLAARGLTYSVIKTGKARHLMLRLGSAPPLLALAAHYDRVEGSPGVLDNSCACLQLVEFAVRSADRGAAGAGAVGSAAVGEGREVRRGEIPPSLLILFTDGEETPAVEGAAGQGAFALARALAAKGMLGARGLMPPVLVFDVTGRGGRLILSSAPGLLLRRHGLDASLLAAGHRRLVALARSAAARSGLGEPAELELPWSDDLGLVLGGVPALTVSLLPEEEARLLPATRPRTWAYLHSPEDGPALAEERAFTLMASFLDATAAEIAASGRA